MRLSLLICFLIVYLSENSYAQNPVANFTTVSTACLNETITLTNNSINSTQYIWDFCHDDLKSTPTTTSAIQLPTSGTFFYHSIKFIYDNGEWIGFFTDMNGLKLYRLDFGNSLTNTPTVVNLGTLTGFTSPSAIDLIQSGGIWHGFITNLFNNTIVRVRFDNGIKGNPTAEAMGNFASFSNPSGVKILSANSKYYVYVTNLGSNSVSVIDFGNSPQNSPAATKLIGQSALTEAYGISLISQGASLFALIGGFSTTNVYLLNFGTDPYSDPMITNINGIPNGADVELALEGQQYFGIVRSRTDGIYRIDLGPDLSVSSPSVTRIGPLGVLTSESRGMVLLRDAPSWKAFTIGSTTGNVYRLDFSGNCSSQVNMNSSNAAEPSNVTYKAAGAYTIELTANNAQGQKDILSKTINVLNVSASGIGVTQSDEQCVGSDISFLVSSAAPITSYSWNFGDGTSSLIGPMLQHQYANPGNYSISLTAIEQNGCTNHFLSSIDIYSVPVANFSNPLIVGQSCTLQDYLFTNQSVFDQLSNPSWTWKIDGTEQATTQNFDFNFDNPGTYNIELTVEIPGCSNSYSQNFEVDESGILVDFTFTNLCRGDNTQFNNTSNGIASGFNWDFGDGQGSTQVSPVHIFPSKGSYDVLLTASNVAGCLNSRLKTVLITSSPQPSFFTDLPPFSCAGTPTQFHDATPSLTDSNIVSWTWSFNDGTGATANQKDPLHTFSLPGTYQVALQVTTNFGCSSTIQVPAQIAVSPSADFDVGAACLNKPTQFEDASSPNLQSWSWIIGSSIYSVPNPIHTFTSSGSYSVNLTVKGANNCEAFAVKTVEVKPIPSLDFSTSLACSNQGTIFTDQTTGVDKPDSWLWNFGNGQTVSGSPANFVFDASGLFPVGMSIITKSGCSYSLSKNTLVAPSPEASFTESTSFGPPPLLVQFTNTSVNGSTASWEFNDPQHNTSLVQNPLFTFNELGDYQVQLTASNVAGCEDTFSKVIKVLIPVVDISLEELEIQENSSTKTYTPIITVKNNSNIYLPTASVLVSGSSGIHLRTTVPLNLSPGGTIEVVVLLELFSKEKYLCVELEASEDIDLSNNSVCKNLKGQPIMVKPYPNPSSGTISFEAILDVPGSGKLRIVDAMGHMVFNQAFSEMASGMNRVELDFSGKNPGLYLAIWELNGLKTEFRFIIN